MKADDAIALVRSRGGAVLVGQDDQVHAHGSEGDALPDAVVRELQAMVTEIRDLLRAERMTTEPIEGHAYAPLAGPPRPWPSAPFLVPDPCARCGRVAWPDDGGRRLSTGKAVCGFCLRVEDLPSSTALPDVHHDKEG